MRRARMTDRPGDAAIASGPCFGGLLRACRERGLLSQEQLAERSGVSARTIRDLEAGKTRRPRGESVRLLADALGLVGWAREQFEQAARSPPPAGRLAGQPVRHVPAAIGSPAGVVPAQLPADVAGFTGRGRQLRALDALLEEGGDAPPAGGRGCAVVISAIAGTAGVGKTALAVHWAHRVRERFGDGQLYVNLHGYAQGLPLSPLQALAQLLGALGVEADRVPVEVEQAAGLYRSLLAGRRVLVVLDNARDAEQVRSLVPGGSGCLVVVTSRDQLGGLVASHGARRLMLDVLVPREAVSLLAQLVGQDRIAAEPEAAAQLAEVCGYLPLAVRIAAANLTCQPDQSLAGYLARLCAGDRLAELAVDGDVHAAVRVAFDCSYAVLDPDAARLFRLLGLVPGADFSPEAAAALAEMPVGQARRLLERLAGAHLLEPRAPGRFGFHDLLHVYARQRSEQHDNQRERDAALRRLLGWYLAATRRAALLVRPVGVEPLTADEGTLALRLDSRGDALRWFEAERSNLLAAVDQAAAVQACAPLGVALVCALPPLLRSSWHGEEWGRVNQLALQVAQQLGDRPAQARIHLELAIIRSLAGDHQDSTRHTEDALLAYRTVDDHAGETRSLINLGALHHKLGRLPLAMPHYEQALDVARRIGHRQYEAYALANLAAAHRDLGRLDEAVTLDMTAISIFRDIGDRHGEADATDDLALAHRAAGRYKDAVAAHREALGIVGDLSDRPRQSSILRELAATLLRAGAARDAVTVLRQALTILERAEDRYGQARARRQLGAAFQALGDHNRARQCWEQALLVFAELGAPEADEVRADLTALRPG
jgi:tetratricopeptide (TPR) repeat protein/transcriptional regulator with XRE-family HTH domain